MNAIVVSLVVSLALTVGILLTPEDAEGDHHDLVWEGIPEKVPA